MCSGRSGRTSALEVTSVAFVSTTSCSRSNMRQVRFRDVVAERVKEARRDHLGAGRQFGSVSRVEAQQVDAVVRVPEHERWPQPLVLQQQDVPGAGHRRGLIVPAAASQLRQAHARAAVTIHVPRAVEHVAQRIDALRRDDLLAGMPLARAAQCGRHRLEQHAEIARPGIGRGQRRRLAQQRVVGIELLRRRLAPTDADRDGEEREHARTRQSAVRPARRRRRH